MSIKLKHYCGLFGIIKKNGVVTLRNLVDGIHCLQHRGQDSTGLAYYTAELKSYKNIGLVKDVFSNLEHSNEISSGISHVRYSTRDKTSLEKQLADTQPFILKLPNDKSFTFAHNGNVPNIAKLIQKYQIEMDESEKIIESDSFILGKIIQKMYVEYHGDGDGACDGDGAGDGAGETDENKIWKNVMSRFVNEIAGVYCLLILTDDSIYAVKDSSGVRPLSIFENDNLIAVASESISFNGLENFDPKKVYELNAGEIVQITNGSGRWKTIYRKENVIDTFCSFEYIYFFRHNSTYKGKNIEDIRVKLGKELAMETNGKNDKLDAIVVCIPQTSISSAKGFSKMTNIPFIKQAITKSYKVNRTFILQNDEARQDACRRKFLYNKEILEGKNVYLIDDSIVRGNTLKIVVKCLRECAVNSIHIRIPSPPIISECYFGIDMSTKKELIAYNHSIDEMLTIFDVDSLAYLTINGMKKAFSSDGNGNGNGNGEGEYDSVCTSCFTGKYDKQLLDW